ncbi:dihydroxyacetone kinase subunit L [Mesorhizobium sp. B3-1-6]|uniref:dihydroxyacetone kinase subunit L n=1 Tax=Mesorhizobium sp. B3-1-6 TaxID=2589895 RepID=UPI00112DAF2A|nr:dihydroxyacetone kinase subunit L [Mesorhizobium sp. B3-1-6]TPI41463.1 dihydroxyacetone kinase subunit L [Mesorhizobium sp. B3-1-6]
MVDTGFKSDDLASAATAIAAGVSSATYELNDQDGKLGDGDLGITVSAGWQAVAEAAKNFPPDIGLSFLAAAKAFQSVSSSSFGTIVASAFMAIGRQTHGTTEIAWRDVPDLLAIARDAMIARGKGSLGDKTVLDSLEAVRVALAGIDDPVTMRLAASHAANAALEAFRQKANKLGRARMFAQRSIGQDDPGMLAFSRIIAALPA